MRVRFHTHFYKSFHRHVKPFPKIKTQFERRIKMFEADPQHPLLKDHPLKGDKQTFRAFSITGDIRVIYYIEDGVVFLFDVGSHNQVY